MAIRNLNQLSINETVQAFTARLFFVSALLLPLVLSVGCESHHHPWKGTPYQEPGLVGSSLGSTYAPVPQILPQVDSADLVSVVPNDEELERMFGGLTKNLDPELQDEN